MNSLRTHRDIVPLTKYKAIIFCSSSNVQNCPIAKYFCWILNKTLKAHLKSNFVVRSHSRTHLLTFLNSIKTIYWKFMNQRMSAAASAYSPNFCDFDNICQFLFINTIKGQMSRASHDINHKIILLKCWKIDFTNGLKTTGLFLKEIE